MTVDRATVLDPEAVDAFAHLFRAMADRSRLSVLQHLSWGEHRVRDLVDHLNLAQSTVSKHIAFLAECGLIRARVDGRATWYALAEPVALRALTVAAERLLDSAVPRQPFAVPLASAAHSTERTASQEQAWE